MTFKSHYNDYIENPTINYRVGPTTARQNITPTKRISTAKRVQTVIDKKKYSAQT